MLQLHEIAHYGRWFPYDGRILPYWWYDTFSDQVINIDDMSLNMNFSNVCEIDVGYCICEGKIPFFRVNIPELELKYANEFMRDKVPDMMRVNMEKMDYDFRKYIDENNLIAHWYKYELGVLLVEARKWCYDNNVPYIE